LGDALDLLIQVTDALGAAHEAGIVHRDVKPENIMARRDGIVKVLDFGLAKLTERAVQSFGDELPRVDTRPGIVMGTVNYMSPEQVRGQEVDARSDLFSLGVVMYEMLAGRPPFASSTPGGVIASLLGADPPPLGDLVPHLPAALQHMTADARDEALEMGLADTLITRLSGLKNLSVRPLSAVRRYTAFDQDPVAAGRELQVEAVLEGSIQKVGDKVRVTARLVNVADGKTLWIRQFDERWTDIFAVQDAIAQRVADDLTAPLTGEERGELVRNYTADPEAYRLYMEGRYQWGKRTGAGMRKAVDSFQQAISRDPHYALAHVGLADAYATLGSYHQLSSHEALPLAKDAAMRALSIDQNLAEAHASMGKILTDYYWDWEQAEREFQLAIKLKPNYANGRHWYSTLLAAQGRFDEAVSEANRALELEYFSPVTGIQVGHVLHRARRFDQAIAALRKTLDLETNFAPAHYYLGQCYLMRGNRDEAMAEFERALQIAPNTPDFIAMIGYTHAVAGRRDQARRCLAELDEVARSRYTPPFGYATIYAGLGEPDLAFNGWKRVTKIAIPGSAH
jgi:serine/threonine protein kinase